MIWQFSSDRAIYLQIADKFTEEIVSGRLEPGERLPSVRETAREAGVNPNVVVKAFANLAERGIVRAAEDGGYFVTEETNAIQDEKAATAKKEVEAFFRRMARIGYKREQSVGIISSYKEEKNE